MGDRRPPPRLDVHHAREPGCFRLWVDPPSRWALLREAVLPPLVLSLLVVVLLGGLLTLVGSARSQPISLLLVGILLYGVRGLLRGIRDWTQNSGIVTRIEVRPDSFTWRRERLWGEAEIRWDVATITGVRTHNFILKIDRRDGFPLGAFAYRDREGLEWIRSELEAAVSAAKAGQPLAPLDDASAEVSAAAPALIDAFAHETSPGVFPSVFELAVPQNVSIGSLFLSLLLQALWMIPLAQLTSSAASSLGLCGPLLRTDGTIANVGWTLFLALLLRFAADRGRRTHVVRTALTCIAFLPVLAWLTYANLRDPLLHDEWCAYCGPSLWSAVFFLVVPGSFVTATISWLLLSHVARVYPPGRLRRWLDGAAVVAVVAASAMAMVAALRSLGSSRASWPTYVRTLPVVAELVDPKGSDPPPAPWTKIEPREGQHASYEAHVAGLDVVAYDYDRSAPSLVFAVRVGRSEYGLGPSLGNGVLIWSDARRDLLFVETKAPLYPHRGYSDRSPQAYRASTLERVALTPIDFARDSGPPYAWIAASFAGIAVAIAALRSRSRVTRDLAPRSAWHAATLDGAGRLLLADGTVLRAPTGFERVHGAVVATLAESSATGAYRDAQPAAKLIFPGTVADLENAVDRALAFRSAFALVAILVSSTPLAIAACLGFLG